MLILRLFNFSILLDLCAPQKYQYHQSPTRQAISHNYLTDLDGILDYYNEELKAGRI